MTCSIQATPVHYASLKAITGFVFPSMEDYLFWIQYISLRKGESLPICQLSPCNLSPGPKPLKGSSRPFPKLPIEEQKQYHFWKTTQSFIKPCRPSSPYTFTSVILHKLKHFSTSNMFCQVVFSWLSFSTTAHSANSEPCLNVRGEVTF